MKYGLKDDTVDQIKATLTSFEEVERAIIYGSRAKGTFKPASDIDLTLEGTNLTLDLLNAIAWKLDDLLLPYTFDLSIKSHIANKELLDHIERVGIVFYEKSS